MEKLLRIKFFYALLDLLTDAVGNVQDYLCELKTVKLAEWVLFWFNASLAFSFSVFTVKGASPSFDYIFSETIWTFVFDLLLLTHFLGFYLKSLRLRYWSVWFYSCVWTVWTIITSYARINSPLWESVAVITVTAVVVGVRLKEELDAAQIKEKSRCA